MKTLNTLDLLFDSICSGTSQLEAFDIFGGEGARR